MKVKINEPKEITTSTGKKKVLFRDDSGNSMDSWDLELLKKAGQIVEGTIKEREWQGKTYTTFTPTKQSESKTDKPAFSPEYLERKNDLSARQTALNCATEFASAKVQAQERIDSGAILIVANEFVKWLKNGKLPSNPTPVNVDDEPSVTDEDLAGIE